MSQGTETYTHTELDELVGATLFVGRLHNAIASVLDVLRYADDPGLIELMNHAPVGMLNEILPATLELIDATIDRLAATAKATESAIDSADARADGDEPSVNDMFAEIIHAEFAEDRKKNGG